MNGNITQSQQRRRLNSLFNARNRHKHFEAAESPDPIVTTFKHGDDPAFEKPDHDPHGETEASAGHSGTVCNNCGKAGLVPTVLLEEADGLFGEEPRDVICKECGETEVGR